MSAEAHEHEDHEAHYGHIFKILLIAFFVSFVGPFIGDAIGMRWITLFTAFGIAFYKAYLVIVHFMHLPVEKTYIAYLMGTVLIFMGIFVAGVAPDVYKHEGATITVEDASGNTVETIVQWKNMLAEDEINRREAQAVEAAEAAKKEVKPEAGDAAQVPEPQE